MKMLIIKDFTPDKYKVCFVDTSIGKFKCKEELDQNLQSEKNYAKL